jgi:DNA replication and repair protein RecF
LDDLASELDRNHQQRVLKHLLTCGAQVFVTGTEPPAVLEAVGAPVHKFHVEHAAVLPAVDARKG